MVFKDSDGMGWDFVLVFDVFGGGEGFEGVFDFFVKGLGAGVMYDASVYF